EASEDPRARRADLRRPERTAPSATHSGRTARPSERVARGVPGLVGSELSAPRHVARGAASEAVEAEGAEANRKPRLADEKPRFEQKETKMTTMPKAEVTL